MVLNNSYLMFVSLVTLFFLQEHDRDMTQLAEDLSSLSLNNSSSEAQCKLAELVKARNIMKFISAHPNGKDKTASPFTPEEMSLLKNIPKGTCMY